MSLGHSFAIILRRSFTMRSLEKESLFQFPVHLPSYIRFPFLLTPLCAGDGGDGGDMAAVANQKPIP